MTLTGESIDAATASRAGLVHDVVQDGALELACSTLASTLALRSPTALRLAKRAQASGSPFDVGRQADGEQYANLACMLSEERRASVAAFTARSAGQ
jgi:enoyl-CoA hydratase/carnithine racemase